jgi:predicted HAD superfamily hydrolase
MINQCEPLVSWEIVRVSGSVIITKTTEGLDGYLTHLHPILIPLLLQKKLDEAANFYTKTSLQASHLIPEIYLTYWLLHDENPRDLEKNSLTWTPFFLPSPVVQVEKIVDFFTRNKLKLLVT